jgi:hypothetical protein
LEVLAQLIYLVTMTHRDMGDRQSGGSEDTVDKAISLLSILALVAAVV